MVTFILGSLVACSQNGESTTVAQGQTDAETTVQTQTDTSSAVKETAQPVVQRSVQATQEKTETKTTQVNTQVQTTKEAATAANNKENPKITVDELFDANTVSMLLNNYSCVRVEKTLDFGKQTEQYSLLDDEIIQIVKNSPKDGAPYYCGRFGAFYFEVESYRTKAYIMLDDLNSEVDFPAENRIAALFSNCKASFVKETGDCYIYKVTYPDMGVDDMEITVTVKKDTLAVVKAVYKSDGEITETAKITLGAGVKDYAKILSKWNAKRKIVTVIAEKQQGNNKTVKQTELKLPSDWEITVNDSQELTAYMDSDYTVPYQYPGNGKSYKLYVTNSMG